MNKIFKITKDILKITDVEIKEIQEIILEQKNYISPFKLSTMEKQHKLGKHNEEILNKLLELKCIIEKGE